jgi:1-acyl-sn-glycerol-3-phosphate acyltransferase
VDQMRFEHDTYKTETRRLSLAARLIPSIVFYGHLLRIVRQASKKAKQGRYDTKEWCASSLATLRALEQVGIFVEIAGIDHFRALPGPCVFIGNHMSTLETFVLPVVIAPIKDTTFVVKQSLVEYPVFKYVMRSRNPITVCRSNARDDLKAVLEGGVERLKAGLSIIIFPQTTRSSVFDHGQFNTIGIKLAKRAGVPAVPVALKTDAWGNGRYLKDFGRINPAVTVHFAFGEPLMIRDRGVEEHQRIIDFIMGKLGEWGGETKNRMT